MWRSIACWKKTQTRRLPCLGRSSNYAKVSRPSTSCSIIATGGDLLRYMLSVMHLQKRLARRDDVLSVISQRLNQVETQVAHFGTTHENVVSNIADIYTDTISKFQYRIQVTGEYHYLQQARVAGQIRVLLLAAIRAITLWRQIGGSRWHLLFYRNRVAEANTALLGECQHS